MKTVTFFLSVFFLSVLITFGQGQQSFSYQAVVRNNSGEIIANHAVGFRITLHNGFAGGSELYKETHSTSTNQFGLVSLQIGNGTPVSGLFSEINWGDNFEKFIEIEVDASGGTNYVAMGTSQLLSVPFSFNAKTTSGLSVMTSAERDAITSPEMGMALFNSDTRRINYHDGYGWLEITGVRQADFTCGNPLLDSRDGTYYNTVEIGGQCWMAENLNYGMMIDGTTNQSDNAIVEKYCYSNNPNLCDNTYGALYQWKEMMQYTTTEGAQGICPEDWHLPTLSEWTTLINASGGPDNAGTQLVAGGSSGFEALMAGQRNLFPYPFMNIGQRAYFWSSTQINSNNANEIYIINNDSHAYTDQEDMQYGYSVRCIKN